MEEGVKKGYALQERIDIALQKYWLEGRRWPDMILMSNEGQRLLVLACYSGAGHPAYERDIELRTYKGIVIKTFHGAMEPEFELVAVD